MQGPAATAARIRCAHESLDVELQFCRNSAGKNNFVMQELAQVSRRFARARVGNVVPRYPSVEIMQQQQQHCRRRAYSCALKFGCSQVSERRAAPLARSIRVSLPASGYGNKAAHEDVYAYENPPHTPLHGFTSTRQQNGERQNAEGWGERQKRSGGSALRVRLAGPRARDGVSRRTATAQWARVTHARSRMVIGRQGGSRARRARSKWPLPAARARDEQASEADDARPTRRGGRKP